MTLEELKAPLVSSCTMHISESGPVQAFCGYFDVDFKGSEQNPADNDIRLSTAPDATGALAKHLSARKKTWDITLADNNT